MVLSAPNWLIFWGLLAPLAAVVVIERLDKPSSNVPILFLFWHRRPSDFMPFWHIENTRKYAIKGDEISYRCIKTSIIIMIVPPPTDVKNARCQRSIFGIKRGHNHDQVDERKTKKRRKNDVENEVDEGKKLCPIFGTLSHLWYIKNNTNRVLNRTQSRRRSPTI